MAVRATLLTSGGDSVARSTYTTATITPSPNKLILISVATRSANAPTITSITGCGLTFTSIGTGQTSDFRQRNTLLRATSSSTSTGTLSIVLSGNSDNCQWIVSEFDNVDVSGTNASNAIVQSQVLVRDNVTPSTGTTTITLNAFEKPNNAAFGTIRVEFTTGTINPGSGFTELAQVKVTNTLQQEFKDSADTTVDWDYVNNVGRHIAIAAELRNLEQGGSFLYNLI